MMVGCRLDNCFKNSMKLRNVAPSLDIADAQTKMLLYHSSAFASVTDSTYSDTRAAGKLAGQQYPLSPLPIRQEHRIVPHERLEHDVLRVFANPVSARQKGGCQRLRALF